MELWINSWFGINPTYEKLTIFFDGAWYTDMFVINLLHLAVLLYVGFRIMSITVSVIDRARFGLVYFYNYRDFELEIIVFFVVDIFFAALVLLLIPFIFAFLMLIWPLWAFIALVWVIVDIKNWYKLKNSYLGNLFNKKTKEVINEYERKLREGL